MKKYHFLRIIMILAICMLSAPLVHADTNVEDAAKGMAKKSENMANRDAKKRNTKPNALPARQNAKPEKRHIKSSMKLKKLTRKSRKNLRNYLELNKAPEDLIFGGFFIYKT